MPRRPPSWLVTAARWRGVDRKHLALSGMPSKTPEGPIRGDKQETLSTNNKSVSTAHHSVHRLSTANASSELYRFLSLLVFFCFLKLRLQENLLRDHGVVERNRIASLQSHGKALEKECCLPGVFCDSGDTTVNILCELNGHRSLMPCTSCLYGRCFSAYFSVFVQCGRLSWLSELVRLLEGVVVKSFFNFF